MQEALRAAMQAIQEGRSAALATPVATEGSVPTGRYARMMVGIDGGGVGTIGGGAMEAEVTRKAIEVARQGKPRLVHCRLTAEDAMADGLLCGGQATFWVEPLYAESLAALSAMVELIGANRPCVEAVRLVEGEAVRRLVINADGQATGSLGAVDLDEALSAQRESILSEDSAMVQQMQTEDMEVEIFVQAVQARPTVFIFGGGHVGLALARLAPTAGMDVVVVDDREEFCHRDRFPMASGLHVRPFTAALDGLDMGPMSYVVVMTRGHKWDREVVAQALRTPAGYIGMIGSGRKISVIWKSLRDEGFSDQDLNRVYAPVGLDIGGDTPGEIAISIMAQLIQVRRKGG